METQSISIPKNDQIQAMLEGRTYELISPHLIDAGADFRKYLTVTRPDVTAFVQEHPDLAEIYFAKQSERKDMLEMNKLRKQGAYYQVLWVDHGKIRSQKQFSSLAEAVVEHVLIEHGMY